MDAVPQAVENASYNAQLNGTCFLFAFPGLLSESQVQESIPVGCVPTSDVVSTPEVGYTLLVGLGWAMWPNSVALSGVATEQESIPVGGVPSACLPGGCCP